ncbi:MAG: hypothetical protein KDH99_00230 [Alcanivoracaceae bacterium]|nr:hypothetical protein [Alcanivoracaceae bacterium]
MSRMVRESQVSGLRERHWFAQVLLNQLQQRQQQDVAVGELLALRGAVVFHLYSALVGLARHAARGLGVKEAESLLSLAAISAACENQGVHAPEIQLIDQARTRHDDPLCWLEQQMMAATGASGLSRRPVAPRDENALGVIAEDPYAPLARGDLERLQSALQRVKALLDEAATYMEEW